MAEHPINLALRFILEIAALIALGYWGWMANEGVLRYALAISLPIAAAVLWATFRVTGEAGADQPIFAVPGVVRLLMEVAFFSFAVWGLYQAGAASTAWILGGIVLVHYLISYDRIWWLLQH